MSNKRIIVEAKDILTGEVIRAECYEELAGKIVGVFKTEETVLLAHRLEKRTSNIVKPHHIIREYREGEDPGDWPPIPSTQRLHRKLGYYRVENSKGEVIWFKRTSVLARTIKAPRLRLRKARDGKKVYWYDLKITSVIPDKIPRCYSDGDVFTFPDYKAKAPTAKIPKLRWHTLDTETGEELSFHSRPELCEHHKIKPGETSAAGRTRTHVPDTTLLISRGKIPWWNK